MALKGKKIHEILETPGTWTRGTYYRNEKGHACSREEAASACIYGLMMTVTTEDLVPVLRQRLGILDLVEWNDSPDRTQEEVHALCKELDI